MQSAAETTAPQARACKQQSWVTPLRNRVPRKTKGAGAGDAVHWKEVSALTGSGCPSMGWVPEGQRAGRQSITTADKSATYVTLGEECDVTFEAQSAGEGFEDVMASAGMRLLQGTMIKEEYAILGGNASVALGTPTAPTVTSGSDGAIADGTYNVSVVALTQEGYLSATVSATGCYQVVTVTGLDNQSYYVKGGSSNKSSTTSTGALSTTNVNSISAYTPVVKGAVAYAWYVGAGGSEKLQAITTINSVKLTAALSSTTQALSAITADCSRNDGNSAGGYTTYSYAKAYNGLMYAAYNSSAAYYVALATGTPGTGTGLTTSGRGSITQIDTMLKSFWDNYRLSIEELYVNAQEMNNIVGKIMIGGANALVRYNMDVNAEKPSLMAGATVGTYFNPFSLDGGTVIPIKIHPNIAPGTIMGWCQNLPAFYQSANVPNAAEMQCRRDYYQIPWPLLTRANQTGVYCESVLKCYAPFALGIITNIGNA